MNRNPMHINLGPDAFPKGFSRTELTDAMYHLMATDDDCALMTESVTLAIMDSAYNPGEPIGGMVLDAVTAKYNRFPRTMAALARVLRKHMTSANADIGVDEPQIGEPKKSGPFATVTVMFPFTDGQSVTVVFHAPEGDPKKVMPTDTLIAFRWLLNKRDITQVVAAEQAFGPQKPGVTGAVDISLDSVGKRITQLVAENSTKFQAAQAKSAESKAELNAAVEQIAQLEQQATTHKDDLAALENEAEQRDEQIASLTRRLDDLRQVNNDLEQQISDLRKSAKESDVVDLSHVMDQLNEMGLKATVSLDTPDILLVSGMISPKQYSVQGQVYSDGSIGVDVRLYERNITERVEEKDLSADGIIAQYAQLIAKYRALDNDTSDNNSTGDKGSPSTGTSGYDPENDPQYVRLKRKFTSNLNMINAIDIGHPSALGYDRALFVSSTTGPLQRLGKDEQNRDLVYALLDFIRDYQANWKKPGITARNSIWKLFDYDKRSAQGMENTHKDSDI